MIIETEIKGPDKIIVRCNRCDYMNHVVPLHYDTCALLDLIEIIAKQTKEHEKENPGHTGTVTLSGGFCPPHALLQS